MNPLNRGRLTLDVTSPDLFGAFLPSGLKVLCITLCNECMEEEEDTCMYGGGGGASPYTHEANAM